MGSFPMLPMLIRLFLPISIFLFTLPLPDAQFSLSVQTLISTSPSTNHMPATRTKALKPLWLCKCGCGRLIKDKRTERAHLEGRGPAAAQVQYALRHRISPPSSPFRFTPSPTPPQSPRLDACPLTINEDFLPQQPPSATASVGHTVSTPPIEDVERSPPLPLAVLDGPAPNADEEFDTLSDSEDDQFPQPEEYDPEWDRVRDIEAQWEAEMYPASSSQIGLDPMDSLRTDFEADATQARNATSLSDEELECIRAFNFFVDTCIPATTFTKLPRAFPSLSNIPSLFRIQARAARLAGILPTKYDCCIDSCCAFTGQYKTLDRCPFCHEPRYKPGTRKKARKQFSYLPIIPRLTRLFASEETANILDYRAKHKHSDRKVCDVFDGRHYRRLREELVTVDGQTHPYKFFSSDRDIALGLSVDGFCPFKHTKQTCWPIVLFNYNLPPDIRFLLNNILCVGVIPGPRQMKDIDSFLVPLVMELKSLANGVPAFDVRQQEIFALHVYLILAFGDIPAIAKLMRMKGHNAKCPCRACSIIGIRIPDSRNTIHYIPLHRPDHTYDPLALPLRSHQEFITQATEVSTASSPPQAERLAMSYGIKGVPVLAALSSLSFPGSFPYDFMHMIWENVMKLLVLLWTNDFKGLDKGTRQPYHLSKTVWEAIGQATVAAGTTIPSAFGCRVPNIAKSRSEFTAEAWSIWTIFLGPVLLNRRFERKEYYDHFVELVRLILVCLRFEITRKQINQLRQGFADWVLEYERLYYLHDLQRVSTCTINVHALLHIADGIEFCGPVWCYWAYAMERFCGSLLRSMKSRRFPFASLDKRVTHLAQLAHLKVSFKLTDELDLSSRRSVAENGVRVFGYPNFSLLVHREVRLVSHLRECIAGHVAVRYSIDYNAAKKLISRDAHVFGKLQRLEGGDMMHASEVVPLFPCSRDMSWVKFVQLVDRFAHIRRQKPVFDPQDAFGQLEYIIRVVLPPVSGNEDLAAGATLLLASVRPCIITRADDIGFRYYKDTGALQVIDVNYIEGVVGRVRHKDGWAIVEREGTFRRLRIADDAQQEVEANEVLAM